MNLARRNKRRRGNVASLSCAGQEPPPQGWDTWGTKGVQVGAGGSRGSQQLQEPGESKALHWLPLLGFPERDPTGLKDFCGKAAERKMVQTHKQHWLFSQGTAALSPRLPLTLPGLGCSTRMEAESGKVQSARRDGSLCKQTGGKRHKSWFDVNTTRE